MTTNYTNLIAAHANYIWNTLSADSTVSTDTFAWVAADLENAETCAEQYDFNFAIGWVESAARQVFGIYSAQYAELASFYPAGAFRA
jgi:hypothetical protein